LIANLLVAAGADRIITMDLHAPQIQGYFDIPVDHLDSSAIFIPYIEKLKLKNLTFAAPDVGSTNRVT
jgi:ribose-phosphate pyrophosphokinase